VVRLLLAHQDEVDMIAQNGAKALFFASQLGLVELAAMTGKVLLDREMDHPVVAEIREVIEPVADVRTVGSLLTRANVLGENIAELNSVLSELLEDASAAGTISVEQKMAALQLPSGSMTDRSTCSTTRSEYGRDPNRRVAGALTLEQEEALLGLMYDHFQMSDSQTLDLETVMRCALTLQCDPDVCKALGAQPVPMEEAWLPEQDWVTDMCFAFTDAGSQLTARSKPSGMVTPEGISYLVAQAIMTDLQSAPAADPGAIPPPAVLVPVTAIPSSADNARSTSRKNSKKKSTKKDVSDADLLADPRSQRKATPTKPKATPKPKKSPKRGATPREVTI
jgi:hypothetical protein